MSANTSEYHSSAMPEARRLGWDVTGSNVNEWELYYPFYFNAKFPEFAKVILRGQAGLDAIDEIVAPIVTPPGYEEMDECARDLARDSLKAKQRTKDDWYRKQPAMCSFLVKDCVSESSIRRVESEDNAHYMAYSISSDFRPLLTLFRSTHTFFGASVTYLEKHMCKMEFYNFKW